MAAVDTFGYAGLSAVGAVTPLLRLPWACIRRLLFLPDVSLMTSASLLRVKLCQCNSSRFFEEMFLRC
jgi:hypothetical protein